MFTSKHTGAKRFCYFNQHFLCDALKHLNVYFGIAFICHSLVCGSVSLFFSYLMYARTV